MVFPGETMAGIEEEYMFKFGRNMQRQIKQKELLGPNKKMKRPELRIQLGFSHLNSLFLMLKFKKVTSQENYVTHFPQRTNGKSVVQENY